MRERIGVDGRDDWTCLCGNTAAAHGFYPCDEDGDEVAPTDEEWETNWYVCRRCGRIIDQGSHEVVKRVAPETIRIPA